jgi:hypothetical protein
VNVDLRKPTEADLARFKECLAADEYHKEQDADSWAAAPGELMTFFDTKGNRVWVRIEKVLRVSIQHDPETSRKALVAILYKGFSWLQGQARKEGFSEVIYQSRAPRLIAFLAKVFGFKPVTDNFHVWTIGPANRSSGPAI